jgi:hypothetical protein
MELCCLREYAYVTADCIVSLREYAYVTAYCIVNLREYAYVTADYSEPT